MTDSKFTQLMDLAAERLGGAVIYANDEFFAEKENLLKATNPVFVEGKYTDRGKWMDGWETRRRRVPGHDFCIVRLGLAGVVRGVVVDTAFFKGNYPAACSIDGCAMPGRPTGEELASESTPWVEILPKTMLNGDTQNLFTIDAGLRLTHLRFHIYPDGGVARLRVHGDVLPSPRWAGRPGAEVDLAAAEHGALVLACNDMFFGSRHNLIMPGRGVNMGDGWETKRSRAEGPDWAIVRLAAEGTVERIEVDTNHFKGNYPDSCTIHGIHASPDATTDELLRMPVAQSGEPGVADASKWREILPRTKLQAHTRHFFEEELTGERGPYSHIRLSIFPDGGVSRMRVHGTVTAAGREALGIRHLNYAPVPELAALLTSCCGARAWVDKMATLRPYRDLGSLVAQARDVWQSLGKQDWLEAFRHHPRIGGGKAEAATSQTATTWSKGEQARVADASRATQEELARVNRAYEEKFGHIYIVCATGKSAEEMLAIAQDRMKNDADAELSRAADEQRKITEIRLDKLVRGG
ncbi:allantoicase [Pendulispora rubella]|uniref:Probable allantoicase n=1 Tax=Pendulispora rubella TaxID=2741070 RepID=A0ABZ2LCW2_9BACT